MSTKDQVEQNVIVALKATRNQTAKDMNVPLSVVKPLVASGHVRITGTRKHVKADGSAQRGRPMHEFALTRKGNDKVRRLKIAA